MTSSDSLLTGKIIVAAGFLLMLSVSTRSVGAQTETSSVDKKGIVRYFLEEVNFPEGLPIGPAEPGRFESWAESILEQFGPREEALAAVLQIARGDFELPGKVSTEEWEQSYRFEAQSSAVVLLGFIDHGSVVPVLEKTLAEAAPGRETLFFASLYSLERHGRRSDGAAWQVLEQEALRRADDINSAGKIIRVLSLSDREETLSALQGVRERTSSDRIRAVADGAEIIVRFRMAGQDADQSLIDDLLDVTVWHQERWGMSDSTIKAIVEIGGIKIINLVIDALREAMEKLPENPKTMEEKLRWFHIKTSLEKLEFESKDALQQQSDSEERSQPQESIVQENNQSKSSSDAEENRSDPADTPHPVAPQQEESGSVLIIVAIALALLLASAVVFLRFMKVKGIRSGK